MRPSLLAALPLVTALLARTGEARAQIWMSRGADGSLHFTNVAAQRRQNARVFISSRDARPAAPAAPPPSAGASVATPVMAQPPMPGASAETRARYLETARDPSRYGRFDAFIREAASLYQLPEALLRAVIRQESDFNPFSVSSSGALGLMQLLPSTAASMTVQDPFDPRQNILGGARYLRVLANTFNGDLILTLAAYNAGSGAVIRYGTVPPYDETQHYVRQVIRYYYQYRAQG
ncbi:MAG: lytic transglycosylase domain-containing protein [Polyangiales bacterium]